MAAKTVLGCTWVLRDTGNIAVNYDQIIATVRLPRSFHGRDEHCL